MWRSSFTAMAEAALIGSLTFLMPMLSVRLAFA